jgi:hypothetical protein
MYSTKELCNNKKTVVAFAWGHMKWRHIRPYKMIVKMLYNKKINKSDGESIQRSHIKRKNHIQSFKLKLNKWNKIFYFITFFCRADAVTATFDRS